MYSAFGKNFYSAFNNYRFRLFNSDLFIKKCSEVALKTALVYMPYTFINRNSYQCVNSYAAAQHKMPEKPTLTIQLSQDQAEWLEWLKKVAGNVSRIMQLLYYFLPVILMYPLKNFKVTEQIWLKAFVSAVEKAGVVWIKIFQYMSHRRDIIGPQMAEAFQHLRENAPTHSFQQTKRLFRQEYGKQIHEIFEQFDKIPIASGSVSQVYKGKLHGRKVAIKVRHPNVDIHIQRDVELLFAMSKVGSIFSKSLKIPIGEESLKKTLIDQIDFNVEKQNLIKFNRMFHKNKYVRFPRAFESVTKPSILVETFVEGVAISEYIDRPHALNEVMARTGSKAFFEMLMKNNFIHADCHSGNLLIDIKQQDNSFFGEVKNYALDCAQRLQEAFIEQTISNEYLKKVYKDSKRDEEKMRKKIRQCNESFKLQIIDAGMVLILKESEKQKFVDFIRCVIQSEGTTCAERIYSMSNYNGKKIKEGQHKQYMRELLGCFGKLDHIKIDELDGMKLLLEMLDIIREHNMKLDGEFATLITNVAVMEGIARDLDPNINILKCAIPYFENQNHALEKNVEQSCLTAL